MKEKLHRGHDEWTDGGFSYRGPNKERVMAYKVAGKATNLTLTVPDRYYYQYVGDKLTSVYVDREHRNARD